MQHKESNCQNEDASMHSSKMDVYLRTHESPAESVVEKEKVTSYTEKSPILDRSKSK